MRKIRYTVYALKDVKRHGNVRDRIRKAIDECAARMRVGDCRLLFLDEGVTVTLSRDDYEDDLVDSRDHARAMRAVATGRNLLSGDDVDAYLDAPTPLAFWRKHRNFTQKDLAQSIEVSQQFIAQMESGQKDASITIYNRLARVLGVWIEDLIPE